MEAPPGTQTVSSPAPYPSHWEADVVLRDGGTAHLRPITPDDAGRLVDFHSRLSEQTIYFRFFAPYPRLSPRDVQRFTHVDHVNRAAIIALVGEEMIGVVRYDRLEGDEAEVAFNIEDTHQGRGLGSVLLEHIAAAARERGIRRFVADVLPSNRKMIQVFQEAGYQPRHQYEDGVLRLEFEIAPTATSVEVMRAREHRAEARSIQRLLRPSSVAVVGASREPTSVGQTVLRNLIDAGFTGPVYPVNRAAKTVAGLPAFPSLRAIPGPVDLVVVAVPASGVHDVVLEAAGKGVHGLLVVSGGFAEIGPEGRELQRHLVTCARANGMRVIGPNSFGVINTHPALQLNASYSPVIPDRGRVGFFSQSGAMGVAVLEAVVRRGLGLSTFVSAGNRADVSGNDLLQYWEDDPETDVVLLYLESIGNPRKFSRLARRVGRGKPVVAVKSGRTSQGVPLGHTVRRTDAPPEAIDALFRQAGVVRVDDVHQMFDVAQVLALQPLPSGRRVAVVGNSGPLCVMAANACVEFGLEVAGEPVVLRLAARASEFERALAAVLEDPAVDSVVTVFVSPMVTPDEDVARVVAKGSARATKTVVSTFLGMRGVPERPRWAGQDTEDTVAARGSVPSYSTPEDAVRALAKATGYAQWRRQPAGSVPEISGVDKRAAERLVDTVLAETPAGRALTPEESRELLGHYGIEVWPAIGVADADQAVAAAEQLGYPVVLKTTAPHLRHRADLGGVWLNLDDEAALRSAFTAMVGRFGPDVAPTLVVQRMSDPGVACVIGSMEDALFGSIVSFGLAGVATELLGDRAYRIPPLTDVELAEFVRSVKAAPLLFGHRGAEPVDVPALEALLARMSRLADDLPELARVELNPVVVGRAGLAVLDAVVRVSEPASRYDLGPRRLGG